MTGAVFVQRFESPGDAAAASPIAGSDATLFVSLCHLDNRPELGAALGIPNPELARVPDTALLMRMVDKEGDEGVARCLGGFVFASWDVGRRALTLGRDCLGLSHTLFFYRDGNVAAFATTLVGLLSLPFVPRQIDEIALADYMAVNVLDTRRTFYRDIERVPTRTMVTLSRAGTRHRYYWSPNLNAPPPYRRDEDYVERARELFDQAVAAATDGQQGFAATLSGGLDSSAVAATAARLGRGERIACYTLVPPPGCVSDPRARAYQDETDKVQALARLYPQLDVHLLMPRAPHPLEEDTTRHFAETGLPVNSGPNFGWFAYLHDAVANGGHKTLITGIHGNVGLTWPGQDFLWALLSTGEWRRFARELKVVAAEYDQSLSHIFLSRIVLANMPASVHRAVHRLRGRDPYTVAGFSPLNPAFIAECDLPRHWREVGFDPWSRRSRSTLRRHRAAQAFDHNLPGRDLIGLLDEQYGFQLRDPHADRRLIEFALSVPETVYRRDGVSRWFARQVFADRLPREILDERRRGAQGGAWFQRLDVRRQEIAAEVERLETSPLASRLLDVPRLKRLVDEWPKDDDEALTRHVDYKSVFYRGVHFGRFIRWVEGGNA